MFFKNEGAIKAFDWKTLNGLVMEIVAADVSPETFWPFHVWGRDVEPGEYRGGPGMRSAELRRISIPTT